MVNPVGYVLDILKRNDFLSSKRCFVDLCGQFFGDMRQARVGF